MERIILRKAVKWVSKLYYMVLIKAILILKMRGKSINDSSKKLGIKQNITDTNTNDQPKNGRADLSFCLCYHSGRKGVKRCDLISRY